MLDSGLRRVIGFCGFKGSGKDTSADHLVSEYGYSKMSFAYPLKSAAKIIWGFSDEDLFGASSKRETLYPQYPFSGLNPENGEPLTKVAKDAHHYWQREKDGEWFPQFLSPRIALQCLGTEHGRRLYEDVWVDSALRHIQESGNPLYAIPDVRFRNELKGIHDAGGVVVRLLRGKRESNHPSEVDLEKIPLDAFDFVIDNQGSKEELYSAIDEIAAKVRVR